MPKSLTPEACQTAVKHMRAGRINTSFRLTSLGSGRRLSFAGYRSPPLAGSANFPVKGVNLTSDRKASLCCRLIESLNAVRRRGQGGSGRYVLALEQFLDESTDALDGQIDRLRDAFSEANACLVYLGWFAAEQSDKWW